MRTWILGGALLLALALPHPAHASGKLRHWIDRYDLRGSWRTKDADHDGVKNRREFSLRTDPRRADTDRDGLRDGDELKIASNPRRPDSDRDGIRDGDENAGVITAFDGTVVTVRRFNRRMLRAVLRDESMCAGGEVEETGVVETEEVDTEPGDAVIPDELPAEDPAAEPPAAEEPPDDAAVPDDSPDEDPLPDSTDQEETVVDLGDDNGGTVCADPRIKPGAIVASIELEHGDVGLIAAALTLVATH